MSAELGTSEDPEVLVPGDPTGVAADARVLQGRARDLAEVGETLRRIDTGAWTGPAARAWQERHDTDVPRWWQGADSLDAAAQALSGHAATLSWAQREAGRAVVLWRSGEDSTAQARATHHRAAADAAARTGPPPAFADPGQAQRRAAREILDRARAQVRESGDRTASALRGEAALAPRDSQKQADRDFYGGIRDSVSGAAAGTWNLVQNPADALAGVVRAAAHPVDTAKNLTAWDDWTSGREPRALGRNTGDLMVGAATLGVGKIASALGRDRGPGLDDPHSGDRPVPRERTDSQAHRTDAVRAAVLDRDGIPFGAQDSKDVYVVDGKRLETMRQDLLARLGAPDTTATSAKGLRETWMVGTDPRSTVTYRTFSGSGGATIDVNKVGDVTARRFHVGEGGR